MDSNGYNESVFYTSQGTCYFCLCQDETNRHEVYYGTANRQKAKRLGYWVNLCRACHRVVHNSPNRNIDKWLKEKGQTIWEQDKSREDFIKEWGRSYL